MGVFSLLLHLCFVHLCLSEESAKEAYTKPDLNGGNKSLISIFFSGVKKSHIPFGDKIAIIILLLLLLWIFERCCYLHKKWCYSPEFKENCIFNNKESKYSQIAVESSTDVVSDVTTDVNEGVGL